MSEEPLPPSPELPNINQNKMLQYAWDIYHGRAGGDFFYSLEENYIYVYEDNVWVKILDKEFQNRIEQGMYRITELSIAQRREIIENFKVKKHLRIDKLNQTNLINFKNCMFNPITLKEEKHKKEHYSTIRIPYNYIPEATCPLWIKTLNEILENNKDKINILQEFLGYCISPDNEQKKGLLLLGETDTGKSTIIDVFRDLIGDENASNVPLQHLSNPQYTPLLINKMVNIDPDVNKNAADYEREFKIITSGKNEKVSCNQKHIPTFEFVPKCKIILGANEFPKITDHSSAFYQRLIIIPCERRFGEHEKDRQLHDKLVVELPGIFNWVVEGLKRLKARGSFERKEFMSDAIEELENENNPSNIFFEDHVEIYHGSEIEKGFLFERYQTWARLNNHYILTAARFSTAVYKKFSLQTPKHCQSLDTRKRIWRNIRYIDFKRAMPEPTDNHKGTEEW